MVGRRLAESLSELVRIPSVNPLQSGPLALEGGPIGEGALAHHVARRLDAAGARDVELHEVIDGRPNVYGFIPGRTDRLVVLDVHLDTVAVEHMTDPPFDGRIEDGAVWGRGALDTKASLGVMLALLEEWHRAGVRPDPTVLVVGSISEESGGLLGALQFRRWAERKGLELDQVIVAEPTRLAPIHGHKGGVALEITVHGRAAHSALPELGANAIDAAAHIISALGAEQDRLQAVAPATELGTASVSVTMINGGTGPNVIPDSCEIVANRRVVPGEDADEVFEQLATLVREASPLPVDVVSAFPDVLGIDAFYQPADTPLTADLARWAGTTPQVAPFGTNALHYSGLARDLVVFGPGAIEDAHLATEHVLIDDLVRLADIYTSWLTPN